MDGTKAGQQMSYPHDTRKNFWVAEKLAEAESRSWPVNQCLMLVAEEITRIHTSWGLPKPGRANVIRFLLLFEFEFKDSAKCPVDQEEACSSTVVTQRPSNCIVLSEP